MSSRESVNEGIARRLEASIRDGALRPGDRLPSVRALCRLERISPGTAVQALQRLEGRGLVESRPRSGYYVRALRSLRAPLPVLEASSPAPTRVGVSDAVARVFQEAGDPRLLPLGAALPAPELLPTDALARCLAAAARSAPERLGRYEVAATDPALDHALRHRFAQFGCTVSPDELVITVGAMEALNLAVRAVARPGEIVAVESPSYFGVLEILESLGMRALPVPGTCDQGLDLDALGTALDEHPVKALILVSNFSNPHGACLSAERRQRLLSLLDEYGVPLIEDDIYGDLHFDETRPKPVRALDREGNVLYCGSFSKSLGPGFRVGWIAAGRFAERVRRLKYISTIGTPGVLQAALAHFLEQGAYERHLRKIRRAFAAQVTRTAEAVLATFPSGTAVSQPRGAYFLWVQLPETVDAFALHDAALRHGVSLSPGPIFCAQGGYANYIRLSCGLPWSDRVAAGIATIGRLAHGL